jgi:enamine deaminase RidA (YjgF/YER057c/UK114 family)
MKISIISPKGLANSPIVAPAYKVNNVSSLIFTTGQVAVDEDGKSCHLGDFRAQAERALESVMLLVEAGGSSIDRIVKLTVFLTDARYRSEFSEVRNAFFKEKEPPISIVVVSALMEPEWLIEIEAIAAA